MTIGSQPIAARPIAALNNAYALTSITIVPDVGLVVIGGLSPAVLDEYQKSPGLGSLTVQGLAPTLLKEALLQPGTSQLTVGGFAPLKTAEKLIQPGVGLATIGGLSPNALDENQIAPTSGLVVVQGLVPTLQLTTGGTTATVTPDPALLTIGGNIPDETITAPTGETTRGHVNTGRRWHGRANRYDYTTSETADVAIVAFEPQPAAHFVPLPVPTFKPLSEMGQIAPQVREVIRGLQTEIATERRRKRRRDDEAMILELIDL